MGRQNLFQKRSRQLRYKEDKRNTGDFEEKERSSFMNAEGGGERVGRGWGVT